MLLDLISHHLPVLTCYYINQIKHKLNNKIRIFDQATIKKFQQKLEKIDLNLILQKTDRITAFSMFIDENTSIFNQFFLLVKKRFF